MKFAIIADDLTGANDSGVQLARYGLNTSVLFDLNEEVLQAKDVVVFDTDSRSIPKELAYQRVKQVSDFINREKVDVIYKKIDSTMRGNIGAEIDAVYDTFQPDFVIIAPGYPKNGRKVIHGYHYLNDQLLHETEIARDPKTPVKESYIPKYLQEQTERSVGLVSHEELAKGESYLKDRLEFFKKENTAYVVFDAVTEEDLQRIAAYITNLNYSVVWVGSAGLANYLPGQYGLKAIEQGLPMEKNDHPALLVVGSVSPVTRRQLEVVLTDSRIRGVQLDSVAVVTSEESFHKEIQRVYQEATKVLDAKYSLALYSSAQAEDIQRAKEMGKKNGFDDKAVSNRISEALGEVASRLIDQYTLQGIVLTGGDTAKQVCIQLNATGFDLIDEVEIGIPLGRLIRQKPINAITKAGAFGNERSLLNAIFKLQGESIV